MRRSSRTQLVNQTVLNRQPRYSIAAVDRSPQPVAANQASAIRYRQADPAAMLMHSSVARSQGKTQNKATTFLQLQQRYGNRYVQRALTIARQPEETNPTQPTTTPASPTQLDVSPTLPDRLRLLPPPDLRVTGIGFTRPTLYLRGSSGHLFDLSPYTGNMAIDFPLAALEALGIPILSYLHFHYGRAAALRGMHFGNVYALSGGTSFVRNALFYGYIEAENFDLYGAPSSFSDHYDILPNLNLHANPMDIGTMIHVNYFNSPLEGQPNNPTIIFSIVAPFDQNPLQAFSNLGGAIYHLINGQLYNQPGVTHNYPEFWQLPEERVNRARIRRPQPVVQRQRPPAIQRRATYDVLDWDAAKLAAPVLQNGADPRLIVIPPTPQISISALVQVNGAPGDPCADHEIGTTQTAWIAWTIADYRGQHPGDGSIRVRHRARMPMRDPGIGGDIWYNPGPRNVLKPGACGDAVGIFHTDGPWHGIPKARNNSAVAGNPLNYLRSYTRGLHLVAYLTAREPDGTFLRSPLRFIYWNSLQDFSFTPNFANPLQMWGHTGQVQVNIGSKGRGATADAPYYTTTGPHYNDHFNNAANWVIDEQP